jgi:oligosaccharide repeat unit polymerase
VHKWFLLILFLLVLFLIGIIDLLNLGGKIYLLAPFIIILLIVLNLRQGYYIFDLLNIFNISSLLFFFSTPLMSLFLNIDLFLLESLVILDFKPNSLDYCSLIILLSNICVNLSYSLFSSYFKKKDNLPTIIRYENFFLLGRTLMITSLPFMLLLIVIQIKYIIENGYLSIYNGSLQQIQYPVPFLSFSSYLFYFGYYFICASKCDRKKFNLYSFIYIAFSVLDSLKGGRFSLVLSIFFYLWYSYKIYDVKYKLKIFFIPFIILLLFVNFLTINRDSNRDNSNNQIITTTASIIASQGRSTQLFSLYLENKVSVHQYGTLLITSNLLWPYLKIRYPDIDFNSQNTQSLLVSNNFKDIITYVLNPDYFLSGGGMGGTYIVELFELGYVFTILFSLVFGFFIYIFSNKYINKSFGGFISFFIFQYIFVMPRAESLPNSLTFLKLLFIFMFFILFFKLQKRAEL